MRFLPEGGALLVSDAARRCGDVRTLLNACRTAGFAAEERDGLLLLTPTDSTLERVMRRMRAGGSDNGLGRKKRRQPRVSVRLTRRKDAPLTADGRRLVAETLRLVSQNDGAYTDGNAESARARRLSSAVRTKAACVRRAR